MKKTYYRKSFDTYIELLDYLNDEYTDIDVKAILYNSHYHSYELFYTK